MSSTGALPIWKTAIFPGAKRRVSDIEYLSTIESGVSVPAGAVLRTDEGTLSATGDLALITATGGKDMYLAKAKISARLEARTEGSIIVAKKLRPIGAVFPVPARLRGYFTLFVI